MPAITGLALAPMGKQVSHVLASKVESPVAGGTSPGPVIDVRGWCIGKGRAIDAVQAVADGRVLAQSPVNQPSPVLAERFGAAGAWAANAGFGFQVDTLGLEPGFDIRLRAIIDGVPVARIGAIRGQRAPLAPGYEPRLEGLLLTSIGRTGTTLLMRMLAAHPEIVAYRNHPYETRAAKYWVHLLKTLARPADPSKRIGNANEFHLDQIAAGLPLLPAADADYPAAADWARTGYLDDIARFSMQSIDRWYGHIAAAQGQDHPRYWIEKTFPDEYAGLLRELYPSGKELILVRDFRDMWASMKAFNERRGYGDFGRERAVNDEAWLYELRAGAIQLVEATRKRGGSGRIVRYEHLVTDPAAALGPILEYLGLDASPASVAPMLAAAAEDIVDHRTSESPAASIGRWQRDLSGPDQTLVGAAFEEVLRSFGYDVA
ncbi:MAG: sulfotransferase family protein [Thermomicrobiales bacterium]